MRRCLFALLLLASSAWADMTTLVQHKVGETSANQATVDVTVTSTTAGNLGVVCGMNTGTLTISGVADNAPGGSSVYAQVPGSTFHGNANDMGEVWRCLSLKGGATTVTITFSAADTSIKDGFFSEVSGLSSPVTDGVNTVSAQTGAGTTDTGAAITTGATDGIAFGYINTSGGVVSNPAGGNEFTSGGDVQATTGNAAVSLIYTTAASHTPVWTDVNSGATYGAATVAFKSGTTPYASLGSAWHPGASPGLGGMSSARFQPSNWWPYSPPVVVTFDPALMAAMEKMGNDPIVLPPQVVADGMTPPDSVPS
jgi:hypothetical protein